MKTKKTTEDRAKTRVRGIILAILFIVGVCIVYAVASFESRRTIKVVHIKDGGAGGNCLITDDMIEPYDMNYREFKNSGTLKFSDGTRKQSIVTWANKDKVVGTRYTAYYLRGNTPLYWDSTTKEQTKKNSYLYNMTGELLNIQLNPDDFGDMIVPGDKINVRVSYAATPTDLPSTENYSTSGSGDKVTVTEKLFNEVEVLDMLNSSGESIFDIYYDFISLTKDEQAKKLEDDAFIKSVKPAKILLEATSEEADNFMRIQEKSPTYLITLLPRTSSNAIIDSLSDVEKKVQGK